MVVLIWKSQAQKICASGGKGTPSTLLGFYIYHNRQENVEVIAEEHSNIVSPKPNLKIQTPKVVSTVRWRFSKPIYGFYAGIVQERKKEAASGVSSIIQSEYCH
ncbi:hypothetical protein ABZX51_007507 [Aspergillus tubingensis]